MTKTIIKGANAMKDLVVAFSGQGSKQASETDRRTRKVEATAKNPSSLPPRLMRTEQTTLSRRIDKLITDMAAPLRAMRRKIVKAAAFATGARKAIGKPSAEDKRAGGMGTTMK